MKNINDIKTALEYFEESSIKQVEATEDGDNKKGNKNYEIIVEAATFIKNENAINELKQFLNHSSPGVQLWAAYYLLPFEEKESVKVLKEIAKGSGMQSLTAETTLSEWQKGNLKF